MTIPSMWRNAILITALGGGVLLGGGAVGAAGPDPSVPTSTEDDAKPDLSAIRARAEAMPVDRRIDIDKRIGATVERVNVQAQGKGQNAIAARLAAEFSTSSEALLDEKGRHGLSWGEMVVAHTLLANSGENVTFLDLVNLRSEGLSWGAVAFGLRFHMEDFEEAIKAEGKVAMGLSKADGKAEPIRK